MSPSQKVAPIALALIAGSMLVEREALGQLVWNNPLGGSAESAANWNPAAAPTATSTLLFNLAGAYGVTFGAAAPASRSITISAGAVTLDALSPHATERVSVAGAGNPTAILNSGRLSASEFTASVAVAASNGSTGTLIVRNTGILAPRELFLGSADNSLSGGGTGTIRVESGGRVETSDTATFGYHASTSGTGVITGTGLSGPSTLQTPTSRSIVVGDDGTGSLDIEGGGQAITGSMVVGAGPGSSGTLRIRNIGGPGTLTASTFRVASNNSAQSAGTASALIDGIGSTATVSGATNVGDADGGLGTLTVQNGGLLTCGAAGIICFAGDTINLTSATITTTGTAQLAGITNVTGGTLNATNITGADSTVVTARGRINAAVATSTSAIASMTLNGPLDLGPSAGAGSIAWSGPFNVGPHALITRVTQGAFVRLGDCTIAGGSIEIATPGVHFVISNGDFLNGFGTVHDRVQVDHISSAAINPTGSGLVFNAPVTGPAAAAITMAGTRIQLNGPSGGFTGMGDLNVSVATSASTAITATGTLSLGRSTEFNGVDIAGGLNVGVHTVTLRDSSQAQLGGLTIINGGRLNCSATIELIGSARLEGTGRVNCDLGNHRSTTTVAPGLAGAVGGLTVAANYAQNDNDFGGGRLELDVAGTTEGQYDVLRVAGNAELGGHLEVTFLPPFVPFESAFALSVVRGVISGQFATTNLGAPARGSTYLRYSAEAVLLVYCPADVNQDTNLDPDDLGDFINCFFAAPPCEGADFNADGSIDPDDLGDFINLFFGGCGVSPGGTGELTVPDAPPATVHHFSSSHSRPHLHRKGPIMLRISRPDPRLLALLAGTAGAVAAPGAATATLINWSNVAGGSAASAANWNPAQLPTSVDDLVWNLNATYAVTFNSAVPSSRTHAYRRGTVTLSMSSPHTTNTGVAVGDLAGDVATVTLTTGSWSSGPSGFVNIGDGSGATGTLNVNDDDADFLVTGSSDLFVGNNGTGTLNIIGGGNVILADTMHIGQGSAGVGSLTVSGFVAQAPFPISLLQVDGLGQSRWGNGGDATVSVLNGAAARFAGDLVMGNLSTSTATATVEGQGLVVGATLDVDGDLLLGRNTSAGTAAGAATLNVNAPGRALVGGTLFVAGDPDGGTATLHLADQGLITTQSLAIGTGATLDLDGGILNISGGTLAWTSTASSPRFNGGVNHPVITMTGGATATLGPTSGGPALVVGGGAGANLCDFDVRDGSDLSATGSVTLGEGSDDFGGMIINGEGSTMAMPAGSTLTVGNAGDARFEAELGATVTGSRLSIASGATSVADVLFENPGTTATFDSIFVGGNVGGAGGDGQLTVNAQAVLNVTAPGSIVVYPPGKIDVSQDAVINAGNVNPLVHGLVELENGAVFNTGLIQFTSAAILRGPNDIAGAAALNGRVRVLSGGRVELVNGDLTVGTPGSNDGFDAQDGSVVVLGAHTLTVNDQNRARFDDVTIDGGHIIAPNGIEIVTPGQDGRLDGTGTITASQVFFESGGSVITSTGGTGITINGQLRNNSGNIDGTRFTFNDHAGSVDPAGWVGAGAINARVVFNSGTEVFALANMTMGLNVFDGVTFNAGSQMHLKTRFVTLMDSNGVGLPTLTDMNGGDLICQNGLVVGNGRVLRGRGNIDVFNGALAVFGSIEPAEDLDFDEVYDGLGDFDIAGALSFGANAHYRCDIAGFDNEFRALNDLLDSSGAATVNGALHVRIINGFNPVGGERFTILRGSSRTGEFTELDLEERLPVKTRVRYLPTNVQVWFLCPADFNEDGNVDPDDLGDYINCFFAVPPCEGADFNADGDINPDDLGDFINAFFTPCP